ncbi:MULTISPECIES: efflux transporter outer membrane subunit [unclassified Enterobacter cloacae complex]|uniref:efflux transporter outer membrane subunit n=1 Tax=unclassified Enterobacter cloacae complex TaxID=2757714 RepID=UPI0018725308|nr:MULTISPECIES: efflux transporter outer membrane subunit [unclassified Enterobacter cloacae complex]MBE4809487.1 efflux transporter outer membrane subunit [Enterobacter cloacae complex sp. P44RS]MBE4826996.1 efflux transporter outer membrane subunit [Enterobacter cloacae complex sp. P42RS]MBE4835642.1 efflux transporter outer membrane subunit [Enterobacter cloacae complex sp. P46RS]MBE4840239.1 efflux transporter outer membrane subunit [Enterobacter cloacae complex sp. P42C]
MFLIKRLSITTVFILTGCVSLAPDYQRPALPVPQQFSISRNGLTPAVAGYQDTGWRTFFVDPQVAGLIREALNNNRDIKMAILKVEEARAQFNVTEADRYPQLNGSAGITYSGGLKSDKPTSQQYDAGLALSYELDFFGKLKNMSEADRQNYYAQEEGRRAVYILLVSNVSQSYFNQQLAYKQLRIARETLENYRQSYAFVEQQLVTGSTNVLALEQARGQIESTQAEIAKREGELAQANHALQLLLGMYRALPGDSGMNASDIAPVKLPPHLSSAILLQRPDIMEAEYQLKAADANIGAARAAFFPSISLTSGLSTGSTELSSLFTAGSGMWNFIPKIDIPIFNAGRNKANLKLAEIRQQQSVVNYEQKIQAAFKQVADALALRDSINQQIDALRRYLDSLQITLQRARGLYVSGAISYINVLDAERSLFSTRQTLLDLIYARQVNEITLFTALGGGWVE